MFVDAREAQWKGHVNLIFPAGYTATQAGEIRDDSGAVVLTDGEFAEMSVGSFLLDRVLAGCSDHGAGAIKVNHVVATR